MTGTCPRCRGSHQRTYLVCAACWAAVPKELKSASRRASNAKAKREAEAAILRWAAGLAEPAPAEQLRPAKELTPQDKAAPRARFARAAAEAGERGQGAVQQLLEQLAEPAGPDLHQAEQLLQEAHEAGDCSGACPLCAAELLEQEREALVLDAARLRQDRDDARNREAAAIVRIQAMCDRSGAAAQIAAWVELALLREGVSTTALVAAIDPIMVPRIKIELSFDGAAPSTCPEVQRLRELGVLPFEVDLRMISKQTYRAVFGAAPAPGVVAAAKEYVSPQHEVLSQEVVIPDDLHPSQRERHAVRVGWALLRRQIRPAGRPFAVIIEPRGKGPVDARFTDEQEARAILAKRKLPATVIDEIFVGFEAHPLEAIKVVGVLRRRAVGFVRGKKAAS